MKFLLLLFCGVLFDTTSSHEYESDELSPLIADFLVGYHNFTSNIYKELTTQQSGNFLVCPLSVNIILALMHSGANDETAEQISRTLNLPEDKEIIRQIYHELIPRLKGNGWYELDSANKMYIRSDFEIHPDFANTAIHYFDAKIENINFEKSENAVNIMNKWVEEKTHGHIKDLLISSDLDKDTIAVLINAMYFEGRWSTQFNVSNTQIADFHMDKENSLKVNMMHVYKYCKYYESTELKASFLELPFSTSMPYVDDTVTMTFVLPNDIDGLAMLEENMEKIIATPNYRFQNVRISVPKFKTETRIEFKPILEALGIVDAFQDVADFSEMSSNHHDLKISKVIQKAFIEMDEEGTSAGASTALEAQDRFSGDSNKPPKDFVADHPFIYYIKSPDDVVMFLGRYIQ